MSVVIAPKEFGFSLHLVTIPDNLTQYLNICTESFLQALIVNYILHMRIQPMCVCVIPNSKFLSPLKLLLLYIIHIKKHRLAKLHY